MITIETNNKYLYWAVIGYSCDSIPEITELADYSSNLLPKNSYIIKYSKTDSAIYIKYNGFIIMPYTDPKNIFIAYATQFTEPEIQQYALYLFGLIYIDGTEWNNMSLSSKQAYIKSKTARYRNAKFASSFNTINPWNAIAGIGKKVAEELIKTHCIAEWIMGETSIADIKINGKALTKKVKEILATPITMENQLKLYKYADFTDDDVIILARNYSFADLLDADKYDDICQIISKNKLDYFIYIMVHKQ